MFANFASLISRLAGSVTAVASAADLPVEEPTLWEELAEYFKTKYFLAYAGDYKNFTIGESSSMTIAIVVIGFVIGMIAAVLISYFQNRTSGMIVRRLSLNQAYSEADAKTLEELGIELRFGVKRSLRGRSFLRKYVHYVGEPVFSSDAYFKRKRSGDEQEGKTFSGYNPYVREQIDFENARFYIPEDIRYAAEVKYEQKKGVGSSPLAVVISIAFLIGLGVLCLRVFPHLLQFADNLVGSISSNK